MPQNAQTTTHFHLHPSRQLALLLSLLYAGGAIIISVSVLLNWSLKLLILFIHGLHFYSVWHNTIRLKSPNSIIYLRHTSSGEWYLCQRDGHDYQASLQPDSLCTFYFMSLCFTMVSTEQRKTLFLLSDHFSPDQARHLRRLLWWEL